MKITLSGSCLTGLTFLPQRRETYTGVQGLSDDANIVDLVDFPHTYHLSRDVPEGLCLVLTQLQEYFYGRRRDFQIPFHFAGPSFYERVWGELMKVPFGTVCTYSQLAERAGSPRASRAVGNACARNPIAIVIPCHRVIARRDLGGYGGGLEAKKWLLQHEGILLDQIGQLSI